MIDCFLCKTDFVRLANIDYLCLIIIFAGKKKRLFNCSCRYCLWRDRSFALTKDIITSKILFKVTPSAFTDWLCFRRY